MHVSQYLNWVAALGVVLIGSGLGLLAVAVRWARRLAPARHRRRAGGRAAPVAAYSRGVASPTGLPGPPGAVAAAPRIERSALLADTIRLNQVAPPAMPSALPITLSITLPVATPQRSRN